MIIEATRNSSSEERYDLVIAADVRFEGGTSTALIHEIRAAKLAGLSTGLLMIKGSLLGKANFPMHPGIRALVEAGDIALLDPGRRVCARLLVLHHPTIFSHPPRTVLRIRSDQVVLILHHPRLDRLGVVQYDLPEIVDICCRSFGTSVILAPVSPVVRRSLPSDLPPGSSLLRRDWNNLIEVGDWARRPDRAPRFPVVIGRHARPDPQKWPDTVAAALAAYPPDESFCRVRILGGGPFLREIYGDVPANWDLLDFSWDAVNDFLKTLDFYVYYHATAWSEAFGRTIVEAMAVGVPVLLPPHFRDVFGDAALYGQPSDVVRLIQHLVAQPALYERQVKLGMAYASRLSLASFGPFLQREFRLAAAGPTGPQPTRRPPHENKKVLFISTNGIGLGHLTQQMAIADRLPRGVQSVFATMSFAMKIAKDAGYLTHFITYHRHYGADAQRWNRALRAELQDLIAFTRPGVIAYDGSFLFNGLAEAIASFPEMISVWVRRPMWRAHHAQGLTGAHTFDHIVEPGELADTFDQGPTKPLQKWAHVVNPILHVDPDERLSRDEARAALGLPETGLVVALQLGSGTNYDYSSIRSRVLRSLARRTDVTLVQINSPIRDLSRTPAGTERLQDPTDLRTIECFPSFKYSRGFDVAIAGAGYNSFHENILGAVPTIFVPNEAPEMDIQLARAQFAATAGLALCLRTSHDRFAVDETIDRILEAAERDEMVRRCRRIDVPNGAKATAQLLADSLLQVRTDQPFTYDG